MNYKHNEAFCLMRYQTDDGLEEEIIWNSRDGITPFVISLRSGKSATHVDWQNDQCVPDYIPNLGDRIFVDLTMEKAIEYARKNLDYWRENSLMEDSSMPTAPELAYSYMQPKGAPDLIEVTQWPMVK